MKKTLSIILSVLMLISCIPMFASAAIIKLSVSNIEIIPPTVSVESINYGTTLGDIALTGGKVWYVDSDTGTRTEVAGHFEWASTTTKPPVSEEYAVSSVRFFPDDTVTYNEKFAISKSKAVIVEGIWPTFRVIGTATQLVEAPTAATLEAGKQLINADITGGKVIDAVTGEDITANGYWSVQNGSFYPNGNTECTVKWSDTGYEPVFATVTVPVEGKTATLVEAPDFAVDATINMTFAVQSGGKVVDESGNDITSAGKFSYIGSDTLYNESTDIDIQWIGVGYFPVTDKAPLTVTQPIISLNSEPKVSTVNPGTTYKAAINAITPPQVFYKGVSTNRTQADTKLTYWTFEMPEGMTEDTILTEDFSVKGTYQREGISTVLTYTQEFDVLQAPTSEILEAPKAILDGITPGMKAGVLTFKDGVTNTTGKFVATDPEQILVVGSNTVNVTFIPDDLSQFATSSTKVHFTLKDIIKFVDSDGNIVVPEIKTLHNAVFGETLSIGYSLGAYLTCNRTSFEYFDAEGNSLMGTMVPMGRNEITVKIKSEDTNYTENTLKFILIVEPKEFTVTPVYYYTNGRIKILIDNKLDIPGEYDVYVNGELIGTTENKEVKWETENSCTVDLELVHKDESGRYVLTNGEQKLDAYIARHLNAADDSLTYSVSVEGVTGIAWNYYMGDVITLECTDAEFYAWSLSVGGERFIPEGLTEEDLKNPVITFTMPDSDVFVEAGTMDDFASNSDCDHLCHSENSLLQLLWKLISFFCQLFDIQQYCDCGITHYDAPLF